MVSIFLYLKKLLGFLNSNERIEDLALSIVFAFSLALAPTNALFYVCMLIVLILFNGNLLVFLFFWPLFSMFVSFFYPWLHSLGEWVLSSERMIEFFELLYGLPGFIFFNWNNTVQLGAYIVIVLLCYPLYVLFFRLLIYYRQSLLPIFKQSALFKVFKIPKWAAFLFTDKL
tara:strand:- start:1770 stop:2285 length:516 start_codon:yes stop_codon:yes gene_type:complete